MIDELKPCPCGTTPEKLVLDGPPRSKWMYVSGQCCGEWNVEFRTDWAPDAECYRLAVEAWNDAPRARHWSEAIEVR